MKRFSLIQIIIFVAAALGIILLLMMNESDTSSLSEKIADYEKRADSLRMAVVAIDNNIHHKDSILLLYLASLDRTLEELNKESAKNRYEIARNFAKQDSVREAYCREMAKLEQDPAECQ